MKLRLKKARKSLAAMASKLSKIMPSSGLIQGIAKAGLIATVFFVGTASTMLVAPQLHETFLRRHVGQVVIKVVKDSAERSGGTGFHVKTPSGNTYILTNAHVCRINPENKVGSYVLVATPDGSRRLMRRIIDISGDADLCLVEGLPNMAGISLSSGISVGEQIAVIGHPLLMPLAVSRGQAISRKVIEVLDSLNLDSAEQCTSKGKRYKFIDLSEDIGALMQGVSNACITQDDAIETNAITYPGNSGSPVTNFFGNLVGVLFAGSSRNNWGYLVPVDKVRDFLSVY